MLCATGAEFMPGNRERYTMSALMSVAARTTRLSTVAHLVPGLMARRVLGMEVNPVKPGAVAPWARQEMSGADACVDISERIALGYRPLAPEVLRQRRPSGGRGAALEATT